MVDVGALTLEEKRQILYNHIKAGDQSQKWKERVKAHLEAVADAPHFLPGMARRLGDPMFTKRLPLTVTALREFVSEPRDHLIGTIEELSDLHQAALALIFVHRGRMPTNRADEDAFELVSKAFNVDTARLVRSIRELQGSFVQEISEDGAAFWVFDHPTILDAATEMFRRDPAMTQIFLLGADFETIAANVVCEGMPPIADAMAYRELSTPCSSVDLRLRRMPPCQIACSLRSWPKGRLILVFSAVLSACEGIFARDAGWFWSLKYDAKILVGARANKLGLMDFKTRDNMAETLERAIFFRNDLSFLNSDSILGLIPPTRLTRITREYGRSL